MRGSYQSAIRERIKEGVKGRNDPSIIGYVKNAETGK